MVQFVSFRQIKIESKVLATIVFQSLQMDPCLDDCVEFAKKLKRLGNPVTLDILEGLPHGFLNFVMVIIHSA